MLKIWYWELIFGRAVRVISSPVVRSPWSGVPMDIFFSLKKTGTSWFFQRLYKLLFSIYLPISVTIACVAVFLMKIAIKDQMDRKNVGLPAYLSITYRQFRLYRSKKYFHG